jgi:hypothetical protein
MDSAALAMLVARQSMTPRNHLPHTPSARASRIYGSGTLWEGRPNALAADRSIAARARKDTNYEELVLADGLLRSARSFRAAGALEDRPLRPEPSRAMADARRLTYGWGLPESQLAPDKRHACCHPLRKLRRSSPPASTRDIQSPTHGHQSPLSIRHVRERGQPGFQAVLRRARKRVCSRCARAKPRESLRLRRRSPTWGPCVVSLGSSMHREARVGRAWDGIAACLSRYSSTPANPPRF